MSTEGPDAQWRLGQFFADLPTNLVDALQKYYDELARFNSTLNLVSPKTISSADALHFADSILASRIIYKDAGSIDIIYDIGSGAGFPGLVFALLYPKVKVNLLEVDQRKSEFLKHVSNLLGTSNVTVLNRNLESLGADSIRVAMSRAFSPLTPTLMTSRKYFPKDGVYYHLKSQKWPSEISQLPIQLCSIWQPGLVAEYKLPMNLGRFAVIKTTKIS